MAFPKGMASRVNRNWLFLLVVSILLMCVPSIIATDYYDDEKEIPILVIALIFIGTLCTLMVLMVPFLMAISDQEKKLTMTRGMQVRQEQKI